MRFFLNRRSEAASPRSQALPGNASFGGSASLPSRSPASPGNFPSLFPPPHGFEAKFSPNFFVHSREARRRLRKKRFAAEPRNEESLPRKAGAHQCVNVEIKNANFFIRGCESLRVQNVPRAVQVNSREPPGAPSLSTDESSWNFFLTFRFDFAIIRFSVSR